MTDKLREISQQAPMAYYALVIKADSGYESTTEGRCTADQYGAAMAALHGTAALAQQDAQVVPLEPVYGDVLPPIGSRVFIRHGRDDDAHACTVTGYYAWPDLGGSKFLHRVFVRMVYEGTEIQQARLLRDCYQTAEAALNTAPTPPAQQDAQAVAQGFDWSKFPGHLIDHYEGEVLTEELLQRAAADLCAATTPPAQQPLCWLDRKSVECLQGSEMTWMPAWNRPTSSDPVPVFLGPPAQRVMLTDEEVLDLWSPGLRRPALGVKKVEAFARAVIEAYERKNGKEAP